MSFARGILKGFLKQGLESKAKSDELYADMVKDVGIEFKRTSQLFQQEEKDAKQRFKSIEAAHGLPSALYASYHGFTTSDFSANSVIKQLDEKPEFKESLKDFDFQGYGYSTAKSSRLMNFKTQNKNAIDILSKHQVGSNVGELYLKPIKPKEEVARQEGEIVRPEGEIVRPELDLPKLSEFKPLQPSRIDPKVQLLQKSIIDWNKSYGIYQVSKTVEGQFDFNIDNKYETQYNSHKDIINKLERSAIGSDRTQSELASISTNIMQNQIINPIRTFQFGDTRNYIKQVGLNNYVDFGMAVKTNNKTKAYDLNTTNLNTQQLAFIHNTINSIGTEDLKKYAMPENLYNSFKSQSFDNLYTSDPDIFKNAYTFSVLITADNINKTYGDRSSDFFLKSLPQVTNLDGININNLVSFRLNQLKAQRLNNRDE